LVEDLLAILQVLRKGKKYILFDDDSYLLNGSVELVEVDFTLVVDVEEFKALC